MLCHVVRLAVGDRVRNSPGVYVRVGASVAAGVRVGAGISVLVERTTAAGWSWERRDVSILFRNEKRGKREEKKDKDKRKQGREDAQSAGSGHRKDKGSCERRRMGGWRMGINQMN